MRTNQKLTAVLFTMTMGISVGAGACAANQEGKLSFVEAESGIYVRELPGTDSKALAFLENHDAVKIIENSENGWVAIESGEAKGFVKKERLITGKKAREMAQSEKRDAAVVCPEYLNIRTYPNGDVITSARQGEELFILGTDGDWLRVETSDGTEGYIYKNYCTYTTAYNVADMLEEEDRESVSETVEGSTDCETLSMEERIYEEVFYGSEVVAEPYYEETFYEEPAYTESVYEEATYEEATYEEPTYEEPTYKESTYTESTYEEPTYTESGYTDSTYAEAGYTESTYEEPAYTEPAQEENWGTYECANDQISDPYAGNAQLGTEVAAYAQQFVGNPYVWGGTDLVNGADCSGFVQSVYGAYGVQIPRVAADQYTLGQETDISDLQPGNLVFYNQEGTGIDHVAMYIGGGQVVMAADENTGIVIASVYASGEPVGAVDYTAAAYGYSGY